MKAIWIQHTSVRFKSGFDPDFFTVPCERVFVAASTHSQLERATQLIMYSNIIFHLDCDVKGKVWQRYDRAFRQAAATQPALRWDWHEPDVWLASIAENGQAHGEGSEDSNLSNIETQPFRHKRWAEPDSSDKTCHKWNRGERYGCCCFAHKCLACGSASHQGRACPILYPQMRKQQSAIGVQEGGRSFMDPSGSG